MDILWVETESLRERWTDIKSSLYMVNGDFEQGRMHAYQEVLNNVDTFLDFGDAEIESQLRELMQKCDFAPSGYTEYSRGYRVGMSECGNDIRALIARTVG